MTYLFLKLYINSIDGNVDVKFREIFFFFFFFLTLKGVLASDTLLYLHYSN